MSHIQKLSLESLNSLGMKSTVCLSNNLMYFNDQND